MHVRVHEVCLQFDGWPGVYAGWIGREEVYDDLSVNKRGDGGRSGWRYNGIGRDGGIDWVREDDRGVFKVHVIAGGRWLVGHRLKLRLVFDFSRRV